MTYLTQVCYMRISSNNRPPYQRNVDLEAGRGAFVILSIVRPCDPRNQSHWAPCCARSYCMNGMPLCPVRKPPLSARESNASTLSCAFYTSSHRICSLTGPKNLNLGCRGNCWLCALSKKIMSFLLLSFDASLCSVHDEGSG